MMETEETPLLKTAETHPKVTLNEILAVIGVTMALFTTGTMAGFSAVALPSFVEPSSEIKASQDELSWIASMANVGSVVGNLMGGFVADLIGRKKSIVFASFVFFCGWFVIAEAGGVITILAGRILTGWAAGLSSSPVQVYICEVASSSMRGASGASPSLTVTLGMLSVFTFGSLLEWRIVSFICSAIPVFVIIYVLFLPESPTWLVAKGRYEEALKTLLWLRQSSQESQKEFDTIRSLKESRDEQSDTDVVGGPLVTSLSKSRLLHRFCEWRVIKPFLLGSTIFFLQCFNGVYPITAYTTLIFIYADKLLNPYLETVFVGLVRMLAVIGAIFVVKVCPKRRHLLMVSGLVTGVANMILGSYFYWKEIVENGHTANFTSTASFIRPTSDSINASMTGVTGSMSIDAGFREINLEWVPLVCILVFVLGHSVGFGIVPWFLMAELMAPDVRSLACSVVFALGQVFLFTSVKTFLDIVELVGAHGAFWFYGGVCLLSIVFVAALLPETANLNDKEIEDIFSKKNKDNVKADC